MGWIWKLKENWFNKLSHLDLCYALVTDLLALQSEKYNISFELNLKNGSNWSIIAAAYLGQEVTWLNEQQELKEILKVSSFSNILRMFSLQFIIPLLGIFWGKNVTTPLCTNQSYLFCKQKLLLFKHNAVKSSFSLWSWLVFSAI